MSRSSFSTLDLEIIKYLEEEAEIGEKFKVEFKTDQIFYRRSAVAEIQGGLFHRLIKLHLRYTNNNRGDYIATIDFERLLADFNFVDTSFLESGDSEFIIIGK